MLWEVTNSWKLEDCAERYRSENYTAKTIFGFDSCRNYPFRNL